MLTEKAKKSWDKLFKFISNPSEKYLLTLKEYESLDAHSKGYACYLQSSWEESPIPEDVNPFRVGTKERKYFKSGSHVAMLEVQDME